jgi:O-antigen ligase
MEEKKTSISFTKWKPIEIMLAVLFLIAPFYFHPNIGGEGLRIPNNITVWIVATIIIWYSFYLVLKRPTYLFPKYFIYIAAFPILITLSGFVTGVEQPLTWLFRLLFIWGGLAFFFSLFQHGLKQGRLDRILFIIVVSALLQGLVGLAQIWLQADMPFWLPKLPNAGPSGLFQQINNQASYQVTAIMIAVYLVTRPFIIYSSLWLKSVLVLTVVCAAFLVAISGSRIGALTLVLGLVIVISALWRRFKVNKKLSLILFFALMVGATIGFTNSDKMIDKTVAMQSGYSGSARLGIYSISLDLIKQQPIFGHGIGSFPRVWQYAKPNFYQAHSDAVLPNEYVNHPHNEVIFWLVESGLIACLGLVLVLIGTVLALTRLGWQRGGAYMAMLLPIALHTQVELPFYLSVLHWFVFMTLLAVVNQYNVQNKLITITITLRMFIKVILLFLFIGTLVFFGHTINANRDFLAFYRGEQSGNPLPLAYKNPYLSKSAQWVDMSAMMYSSIEYGQTENVQYFVHWAESLKEVRPDVVLYDKLLDAYQFLDNKESYCDTAKQGLSLYPNATQLRSAYGYCKY